MRQRGLNGGMFNITIEDAAAAATIGRITDAMAKAGVGVSVDVRADRTWRLIGGGKLTVQGWQQFSRLIVNYQFGGWRVCTGGFAPSTSRVITGPYTAEDQPAAGLATVDGLNNDKWG